MENKLFKKIFEWSFCILFAIIIALLIRYYIAAPSIINQKSMNSTLQEGERIIISRIHRINKSEYTRGQIIIFQTPDVNYLNRNITKPIANYNSKAESAIEKIKYNVLELSRRTYVKRIIGIGGDRIQIKDGNVYLNGILLDEDYLTKDTITKNGFYSDIIVPEGYVFVMGDNRNESMDSRKFGCIPIEKIDGVVIFRYWPLNKFGKIE